MQKFKVAYTITGELPLESMEDFRAVADGLEEGAESLRGYGTASVTFNLVPVEEPKAEVQG